MYVVDSVALLRAADPNFENFPVGLSAIQPCRSTGAGDPGATWGSRLAKLKAKTSNN